MSLQNQIKVAHPTPLWNILKRFVSSNNEMILTLAVSREAQHFVELLKDLRSVVGYTKSITITLQEAEPCPRRRSLGSTRRSIAFIKTTRQSVKALKTRQSCSLQQGCVRPKAIKRWLQSIRLYLETGYSRLCIPKRNRSDSVFSRKGGSRSRIAPSAAIDANAGRHIFRSNRDPDHRWTTL
jgi:hypothetical protein